MSMKPGQVKRIRDLLGLTQEHLAQFLDVTRRRVSEWESGKRTVCGPAGRMLKLMNDDPDYFRVRFFGATPGCPDVRKPRVSRRC